MSTLRDLLERLGQDVSDVRLERAVVASQHASEGSGQRLAELNERLDHMTLAIVAMWDLVKETHGLVDRQLLDRMAKLDELDGTKDGRLRMPPRPCRQCGRNLKATRSRCLYCGTACAPTQILP